MGFMLRIVILEEGFVRVLRLSLCQCHSIIGPCSYFIRLPSTLYNLDT